MTVPQSGRVRGGGSTSCANGEKTETQQRGHVDATALEKLAIRLVYGDNNEPNTYVALRAEGGDGVCELPDTGGRVLVAQVASGPETNAQRP